nr:plexin-B1 [Ciona intestinalis]|eukprot:XP_026690967.1 plexin-B1 [Ciona intestinalis]
MSPCVGCLSSQWDCRWCVSQHTCLPQEGDASDLCTSNHSVCPTILGVAPDDQHISVGQPRAITLYAEHLPSVGTYRCEILIDGNREATVVPATRNPALNEVICNEHSYNYTQNAVTARASISVAWKLNFIVDYREFKPITFFKCSVGHGDCSRCVTSDAIYNCGWCGSSNECTIRELCYDPTQWVTSAHQCPAQVINSFSPSSGPLDGGTRVRISGMNMGVRVEDIQQVVVAGSSCQIIERLYETSVTVVCETSAHINEASGKISVTVRNITVESEKEFSFRNPKITDLVTRAGPQAGGTLINIEGTNLNTGLFISVDIGTLPCRVVTPVLSNTLKCTTSPAAHVMNNQPVTVHFDNLSLRTPFTFQYKENPTVKEYSTLSPNKLTSFLAGGRNISFIGSNFNVVQTPKLLVTVRNRRKRSIFSSVIRAWKHKRSVNELPALTDTDYLSSCVVVNNTYMICPTPLISKGQGSNASTNISDTLFLNSTPLLKMDNHVYNFPPNAYLKYYPNPQVQPLEPQSQQRENEYLKIKVYNLNKDAITKSEFIVMIGNQRCYVDSLNEEDVLCTVPPRQGGGLTYDVTYKIGNIAGNLGQMSYYTEPSTLQQNVIIGIVVAAVVVVIIIIGIICFILRKSKMYKANKNDFQKAMENLEISVRADFRKAFAELSIDMSDLTADIGDFGIPCLDYRTYVTNLFFPSYRYHPCMKEPEAHSELPSDLKQGMSQFLSLLSNHHFLTMFIHTLEEQKSFSNRDKGNVASLLTVVLHQKLDYYTEIMKSLVSDLIAVNVQRNPKLILRRSDSVAERMLSNWMYICLYPYLRDIAGNHIFLLLKAIKQQVSKGPLDAITGKARYTLNDDRLLKEDIETEILTLFVAPSHSTDDEPVIVKVLECDAVTQVKEKVIDAVYKRVLFSQRPKSDELDLEWRHGRQGHLVLPTQGYTMEAGSRWRRLMTLSDYKVGNNATLALIPKQQEVNGSQQDMSNMSNHSVDTTALSPMLPEDNSAKMYHLVKYSDELEAKRESTINRDRHKHIAELYLLRLINMKGILQNYVDAVMQAILNRHTVPCPVKYFFHFLDEIATKHGITDPEVLHIWKTNSLLGRFWVTILKNPESVFDIEKPDTIVASMAVISQTFIDACSVTEHKPTKDSPIHKQLYAKEIPTYKKMVQEYYKGIKEQHTVSDQDVNAYIAEISRKHPCEFEVD